MLGRRPGFTTAAVLTLTLGIGGNTAVFSLVDALMLKHLPVDRPDELVRLIEEGSDPSAYREAFTLATYEELRRPTRSFAGVIASSDPGGRPLEIEEGGQRPLAFLQFVSDNYFDVLGVRAFRGRMLVQPQRGAKAEPAAVISYDYWRRHYAADPSALGRRFRMRTGARTEFTIAGIAPPGFRGTEIDVPTDIWVPIDQVVAPNAPERTRGRWMNVMARLRPGATRAQAEAEGTSIVGRTVTFHRGDIGYSTLRRRLSQPLLLVAIVVVLVLAVACANLANLMLATTTSRARELAVRAAVGASRARVMRQLITESFVLSVMGGVLAIAVAYWMNSSLARFPPSRAGDSCPESSIRTGCENAGVCDGFDVRHLSILYAHPCSARDEPERHCRFSVGAGSRDCEQLVESRTFDEPNRDVHRAAGDRGCVSQESAESSGTGRRLS
jgi:predicted permease